MILFDEKKSVSIKASVSQKHKENNPPKEAYVSKDTCGYGFFREQNVILHQPKEVSEQCVYCDDIAGFILQNKEMIKILKLGGAWSDLYLMKTNLKVTCWADYMGDKVK